MNRTGRPEAMNRVPHHELASAAAIRWLWARPEAMNRVAHHESPPKPES